jgi:arylsulfatase A-like enzyme
MLYRRKKAGGPIRLNGLRMDSAVGLMQGRSSMPSLRRRNILFITADQWRGDCLGVNGHPVLKTPNLDALAADGIRFTKHFTNCVPCSPSRTSLHTGLYQFTHRVVLNGTPLDQRFTNWAAELRADGRDPVLLGYTDTTLDPRTLEPDDERRTSAQECLPGLRQLADCNTEQQNMEDWAQALRDHGYPVPDEYCQLRLEKGEGDEYGEGGSVPLPLKVPAALHETVYLVDQTIEHIQSCGEGEWTVHLSLFRPHPPHIAPAPYNAMYDPSALPPHKRMSTRSAEIASHPFVRWASEWYPAPEDQEQRRQQASYYGLMSEVDAELGRLFAWLKEQGQWDETLVVFTSDHGEQMGDHWLKAKTCAPSINRRLASCLHPLPLRS